jgi:hypothetical protein
MHIRASYAADDALKKSPLQQTQEASGSEREHLDDSLLRESQGC